MGAGRAIVYNTKLNGLRKIICLRKSEVSVEIISVCKVTICPAPILMTSQTYYRKNYDVILNSK